MAHEIIIDHLKTPYGELIIGSFQGKLCLCDWFYRSKRDQIDQRLQSILNAEYKKNHSTINELTKNQLNEYFRKERKHFNIPILFAGSEFQKNVWTTLSKIPYGTTISYTDLSNKIGNPKGLRAVAAANGANAISIIIPCHRIIGNNGDLVGYAGGLKAKMKLLKLEGALSNGQLELFS